MSDAVKNGTFATAGNAAGEARFWTLRTRGAAEEIAAFGGRPVEDFEHDLLLGFGDGDVVLAFFSHATVGFEAFNMAPWIMEMPSSALDSSGLEAFGRGASFLASWSDVSVERAPTEAFEIEWRGNETFAWALLVGAAPHLEPFDGAWTRLEGF